jgi:cytochrome c oxidase assembly protein subunit 15
MSHDSTILTQETSRWPHRLALLLCCATFPLVWVGGLVTTYKAGMSVPDWPTTFGYNLFLYPWQTWLLGPWDLFIEHGHRLFASLVGMLTIALCVSLWMTKQPKWLRVMGLVALAGVIFQGVLGGMRVRLNEQLLAMIHGCFGPAFFAFAAVMATVTARGWMKSYRTVSAANGVWLRRLAVVAPMLAYAQLALGAHLRHFAPDGSPAAFQSLVMWHLTFGLLLAIWIVVMAVVFWRNTPRVGALLVPATALVILVGVQLALGCATWIVKYGWPAFLSNSASASTFTVEARSWWQAQITTAHVATGSLILAVSTVLAVVSCRMVDVPLTRRSQQRAVPKVTSNILTEATV